MEIEKKLGCGHRREKGDSAERGLSSEPPRLPRALVGVLCQAPEAGTVPVETVSCRSANSNNAHSSPPVKLPASSSENAGQPFQSGWEREQQ